MVVPIDVNETREYVLKDDNSEPKSTFRIGFFDEATRAYLYNLLRGDPSKYESLQEIVRYGLRGWDNLGNAVFTLEGKLNGSIDGKLRQVVANKSLEFLYPGWIAEIGNAIFQMNFLSKEQEKN